MIAVAIPKPLAEHPEVVPVDPCSTCSGAGEWEDLEVGPGAMRACGACVGPLSSLVGQRVALAWRETCPTCRGRSELPDAMFGTTPCPDCTDGSRMVVGWTAEVEAVVPIVDEAYVFDNAMKATDRYVTDSSKWPMYAGTKFGSLRLITITTEGSTKTSDVRDLFPLESLADWSPGRYALVLREVWPFDPGPNHTLNLTACLPFDGFAELSEVL